MSPEVFWNGHAWRPAPDNQGEHVLERTYPRALWPVPDPDTLVNDEKVYPWGLWPEEDDAWDDWWEIGDNMCEEADAATATVAKGLKKRIASVPNFRAKLVGKAISIKSQTGTTISGVLRGFSRYDLLVEIDGGECILVSKGAVLFLSSPELASMKAHVPGPAPTQAPEQSEPEFRVTRCR